MKKIKLWLGSLLAVQLMVAGSIFFLNQSQQNNLQSQSLMTFNEGDVNKIVIQSENDTVELVKSANQWQLPNLQSVAANEQKIQQVLSKLSELNTGWPVATTESSHKRFEVAEDKFQKRVTLYNDETPLGDLLLGTSPGFRKTHVRAPDQDNVFALRLNSYEFPDKAEQWMDKSLLAVNEITAIKGPDFNLKKTDQDWLLNTEAGPDATTEVDKKKADDLNRALSSLRVTGVAENAPDFAGNKAVALQVEGKHQWQYQFLKEGDKYYVKRSDKDQVFTVSQYDFDRLAGVHLADLAVAKSEAENNSEDNPDSQNKES